MVEDITEKISRVLRLLRKQRDWSLDAASEKTGVSKAMLGQIERGESSPTIATLWRIATGFDVSFSTFIEDRYSATNQPNHRRGVLREIHAEDNKMRVLPLFPFDETLGFEVFIIELLPGCEHISPPHRDGVVEHVIVVRGELEVLIDGDWRVVKASEGLRFDANRVHGYRNVTTTKTFFHDIIHYRRLDK